MTFNSENLDIPLVQQALGGNSEINIVLEMCRLIKSGKKMVTVFNVTYTGKIKTT